MSKQPKFSEILRAAAKGVMAPHGQAAMQQQGMSSQFMASNGFLSPGPTQQQTEARERAQMMAGMLYELAGLYEKYESTGDSTSSLDLPTAASLPQSA